MFGTTLFRTVSVFALISAFGLSACETTETSAAPAPATTAARADTPRTPERALPDGPAGEDPLSQAAYWGIVYERDPSNVDAAVRYAAALRQLGSVEESTSFLMRASAQHPGDPAILTEYGRGLIAANRGQDALLPLRRAIDANPQSWEAHSLMGVAQDQAGNGAAAVESYERALAISPNNPTVLANYGLSRALDGDLDGAEVLLREAAAQPNATPAVRQNLALVLGLQGNFGEAEQMLSRDLPPEAVANNMEVYRSMLTQPATWNDLSGAAQ